MKHKLLLILIGAFVLVGSSVLAKYVAPGGTFPNATVSGVISGNTPEVLKTRAGNFDSAVSYERLGIGDGTNTSNTKLDRSLLENGPYTLLGTHVEKLVTLGASDVNKTSSVDFTIKGSGTKFDQYANPFTFTDIQTNITANSKPLLAYIAGRYVSNFALTSDADATGSNSNRYSFDLQATSSFNPTTNIGLGNSCNLYPVDIGTTAGDGGGCPAGSFITQYKTPTLTGYATDANNNNTTVVATCTEFNPATSPTNLGHCDTGRTFLQENIHGSNNGKITGNQTLTYSSVTTDLCKYVVGSGYDYQGVDGSGSYTDSMQQATFKGKNVKYHWFYSKTYYENNRMNYYTVKLNNPSWVKDASGNWINAETTGMLFQTCYRTNRTGTTGDGFYAIVSDDYGQMHEAFARPDTGVRVHFSSFTDNDSSSYCQAKLEATASIAGGTAPFTYYWESKQGDGAWTNISGCTSATCSNWFGNRMYKGFTASLRVRVSDANSYSVTGQSKKFNARPWSGCQGTL